MSFRGLLRSQRLLLLSTLIGVGLLSGLGYWQLQRLQWKETLLSQISDRIDSPAAPLPPRENWANLNPDDYDYRHIVLRGTFDHARESYLFRASATGAASDGPGFEVLTPMKLAD